MSGAWLVAGCSGAGGAARDAGTLFTRLPSSQTGVRFENRLTETRELNVFTYRNYYNGGGVALGDLTGDGLPELMLTANMGASRLYLNQGGFRFRDVTEERRRQRARLGLARVAREIAAATVSHQ